MGYSVRILKASHSEKYLQKNLSEGREKTQSFRAEMNRAYCLKFFHSVTLFGVAITKRSSKVGTTGR